jgi:hypothetical protein
VDFVAAWRVAARRIFSDPPARPPPGAPPHSIIPPKKGATLFSFVRQALIRLSIVNQRLANCINLSDGALSARVTRNEPRNEPRNEQIRNLLFCKLL